MVGSAGRTDIDPVGVAAELVAATGAAVLPALSVTRSLGVGREEWTRFARDPLLHKVIRLLSRIAAALDEVASGTSRCTRSASGRRRRSAAPAVYRRPTAGGC